MTLEKEVQKKIENAMKSSGLETKAPIRLQKPPSIDLGHFAIMINPLAGKQDPEKFGEILSTELAKDNNIDSAKLAVSIDKKGRKQVYLNITLSPDFLSSVRKREFSVTLKKILSESYGWWNDHNGEIAVVEHTSANPISPIHIGNLRNTLHGDTLANILERLGYKVSRRYYVNDVGLQIAFTVVGYEILTHYENIKPDDKIDLWLGQVYACMNCFYTIQDLKEWFNKVNPALKLETQTYEINEEEKQAVEKWINSKIKNLNEKIKEIESISSSNKKKKKKLPEEEELAEIKDKKKEWLKYYEVQFNLEERFPKIFNQLKSYLTNKKIDLKSKTKRYLAAYEENKDPLVSEIFREMSQWCLAGFENTFQKYRVSFDAFDYESEITWSGKPKEIIKILAEKRGLNVDEKLRAIRYDYPPDKISKLSKLLNKPKKSLPFKGEIPDLQLTRSDGTALYPAKDIAYSIYKFEKTGASKVFNVVGAEQILPQFQLLLPLMELGLENYAKNLHHYAYEIVSLKNRIMSGRLAQYVTADDFYKETKVRARMAKRASDKERGISDKEIDLEEFDKIVEAITLSTVRFSLLETDPKRRIVLDVDQALDLKQSTGPFVEYALARSYGILRKAAEKFDLSKIVPENVDLSLITTDKDAEMIEVLTKLHNVFKRSVDEMNVSYVPKYAFEVAQKFMKYYENTPILKGTSKEEARARLLIIKAIQRTITIILETLNVPPLEKM